MQQIQLRIVVLLLCLGAGLGSCSPDQPATDDTASSVAVTESADRQACRYGAEAMIDVARQAVSDQSSRPERREARRVLMEDWIARLAAGEDPCSVYQDIGLAATTF